jgi:hypothetical protein
MSDNSYLITKKEDYCVRCKTRLGIVICQNCDGFNFCEQCDFYVHSISSKKQHQRTMISPVSDKQEIKDKSESLPNFYRVNNNINQSINNDNQTIYLSHTNSMPPYDINHINVNHSRISTNPTTLYDLTTRSMNKLSLNTLGSHYRSNSNEKLYER